MYMYIYYIIRITIVQVAIPIFKYCKEFVDILKIQITGLSCCSLCRLQLKTHHNASSFIPFDSGTFRVLRIMSSSLELQIFALDQDENLNVAWVSNSIDEKSTLCLLCQANGKRSTGVESATACSEHSSEIVSPYTTPTSSVSKTQGQTHERSSVSALSIKRSEFVGKDHIVVCPWVLDMIGVVSGDTISVEFIDTKPLSDNSANTVNCVNLTFLSYQSLRNWDEVSKFCPIEFNMQRWKSSWPTFIQLKAVETLFLSSLNQSHQTFIYNFGYFALNVLDIIMVRSLVYE